MYQLFWRTNGWYVFRLRNIKKFANSWRYSLGLNVFQERKVRMDERMVKTRDYVREKWVPDFEWAFFDSAAPCAMLTKPLSECKVALVSSSGVYDKHTQEPFLENGGQGDHSFRTLTLPLERERLAIAHEHYNHKSALEDLNCVLPVDALSDLVQEGFLGALSTTVVTLMGYIPHWQNLLNETAPEIAAILLKDKPDVILYAPV